MKVVFRIYPDGQVIALFPEESDKRTGGTMSYMHIGQHGDADYHGVIQQTKPATEAQYLPLFNELKSIGYKDLQVRQKAKLKWGEKHQQMLEGELHIAIINTDSISPEVGIIKVKWGWLRRDLPQWLIDNGHYDYFYEIPDDEDELIEHFLFVYCDYSQSNLHWQCVPPDTQFKRLTIKDFQK